MNDIEKLEPRAFTKFCMSIGAVPSSYLAGLTIEEQLLWLCSYLEKEVIPTVNNNSEVTIEIQEKFQALKDYVDNYFDNLDVQEEINNKLDAMVEDGTLQEIITAYLQVSGVLAFNNVSSMVASENLINGSFAETYGFYNVNDGGGAKYKIRTITNSDVVDNKFIFALNNEDLIAELIVDSTLNLKQIGAKADGTTDDASILQYAIDNAISKNYTIFLPNGNYLISSTITIDNDIKLKLEKNSVIFTDTDIDLIKMKAYAVIDGGKIATYTTNYSHNLISVLSTPQQNKYGGIYNCDIIAYNNFTSTSNGIITVYENSTNLCFFEIINCSIKYFGTAINMSTSYSNAWCTTFNIGNVHMAYCSKYINMDMPKECSGHHIYNCSIQPVQNQAFDYILNMNKAKYNNIEIMCWDVLPDNTNVIRLSNSCNYNVLNLMPFEYNDARISNSGDDNSFISARMINNTYMLRNIFKTIDLSNLDNTYAYPVLFKGLGNFLLDSPSSSGDGGLTIFAKVVPASYGIRESYSNISVSQYQWSKKLTKIQTYAQSPYYVFYLQGGKRYSLADYEQSQTLSYEIKTASFTDRDLTVEPVLLSSVSKVNSGLYINFAPVEITNSTTPHLPTA